MKQGSETAYQAAAQSAQPERKTWQKTTHESKVENFYGKGAENYIDFHDGYLNFGLWEEGIDDYIVAAENLVHKLGEFAGLDSESQLLDVACGMGTQDVLFMRDFGPRQIDGVDVTWPHIEHGRRRAREAGFQEQLHFHHGTATELAFPDATFSHVISIEGPVHFDTRERFMREAFRVLRPGGVFAMSDYTLKRTPRNPFERLIIESARRMWKIPRENIDSAESYTEKLSRSGFGQVDLREIGAQVIPGYYFEQVKPETIEGLSRIRGPLVARLSLVIDRCAYQAFKMGLIEYIFVRSEKAA